MRQRTQWDSGSRFRSFNEAVEGDLEVSMRPWKWHRHLQWDCGSGFGSFNETKESIQKNFNNIFLYRKVVFSKNLCLKKFGFRGINETVEADLAVSMKPRKWIQWSQRDRGSRFSGVNETAEVDSAVSLWNPLWHSRSPCENEYWLSIPLKGYYSKNKYIQKHYIHIVTRRQKCARGTPAKKVGFRSLIDTAEANFGDFRIEFLSEFEAICETALACESGP
jgi:hypothetical protein